MSRLLPRSRSAVVTLRSGERVHGECQLFEVVDLRDKRALLEGTFATQGGLVLDDAVGLAVDDVGVFEIRSSSWSMSTGESGRSELFMVLAEVNTHDS